MGFVALVNAVKFNFGCCVAQLLPPGPFGFSVVISTLKGSFKTSFKRAKHQVQYISIGYRGLRSLVATWKVYWFEKMTAGFFV